jgi:hypothetical protein
MDPQNRKILRKNIENLMSYDQCSGSGSEWLLIDYGRLDPDPERQILFFWRARVCWPLLCLCRPFMIFEGCLSPIHDF